MEKPTKDYRAEAVKQAYEAKAAGRTVSSVARGLGIKPNTLHNWVQEDRKAKGGTTTTLTPDEKKRLIELEKENRILRMERDILKKATAFFAKESE